MERLITHSVPTPAPKPTPAPAPDTQGVAPVEAQSKAQGEALEDEPDAQAEDGETFDEVHADEEKMIAEEYAAE